MGKLSRICIEGNYTIDFAPVEKAVLKTLIYADIFDYPLKAWEIHKWLLNKKCNLMDVEKALLKLIKKRKVIFKDDFYALRNRKTVFSKRKARIKVSQKYFRRAKFTSQLFKIIPWIKLVGISGSLAMENSSKLDDIDLFVVTANSRLWLSRVLTLGILSLTGCRRLPNDSKRQAAGKICVNLILEESKLKQTKQDLFSAHEVLQMIPLWQRDEIYSEYLLDNEWVFKFLPNWIASDTSLRGALEGPTKGDKQSRLPRDVPDGTSLAMTIVENLAKWLQLKIMVNPQGMERIQDGALYFHPEDKRKAVLKSYRQKIKKLSTP